jgi:hypothetical protein
MGWVYGHFDANGEWVMSRWENDAPIVSSPTESTAVPQADSTTSSSAEERRRAAEAESPLGFEDWTWQRYRPTVTDNPEHSSYGQFSPADAQARYGMYLNELEGVDPMWVRDYFGTGGGERVYDARTGLDGLQFNAEDTGYAHARDAWDAQLAGLGSPIYQGKNAQYWQDRYDPATTPWQRVVFENMDLNTIKQLYESNYFENFANYDDAARQQVLTMIHEMSKFNEGREQRQNWWAASPFLAAAGGMLGQWAGGTSAAQAGAGGGAAAGEGAGAGAGGAAAVEAGAVGAEGAAMEAAALAPNAAQTAANLGSQFLNRLSFMHDPKAAGAATVVPAAIGYGADLAAPYVNEAIDAGSDWYRRLGQGGGGMLDNLDLQDFEAMSPAFRAAAPQPNVVLPDGALAYGAHNPLDNLDLQDFEATSPEFRASAPRPNTLLPDGTSAYGMFSSATGDATVDGETTDTTEGGTSTTGSNLTGEDLQRYVKIAQNVNNLLGSDSPEGAPQRDEGESDADYTQELVEYANLDAAAMAEAGLQPGSPEYYNYILAEMDKVIAQTLGDLDVNAEDFADQLRAKTQEELLALQRALYVRGQMEVLMGSGTYVDPATGVEQEVIGDGMFDPNVGAYQRGLAGNVDELAGLQGEDALSYLQDLIGRKTDMFGMQEAADERYELAKRNEQDALRRRRGMFSGY